MFTNFFPKWNQFFSENSTNTINSSMKHLLEMLGQNKLWLDIKQLVLFGTIFGLIFGSGALGLTDVYADKKDDDKKHDDKKHDDDDKGNGDGRFKHVLRGDGPPPDKLGKKGDLYFDTNTDPNSCMDFYVKIDKKTWEKRGTLCDTETLEIDWNQINETTIPGELLEFAALSSCADGDIIRNESGTWQCSEDEKVESLEELITCENDDEIAKFDTDSGMWYCAEDEGGVVITTVRTIFGDTDEGADVSMSPLEPGSGEKKLTGSCGSNGVVAGYDVLYPEEPEVDKVTFTTHSMKITNSGKDISIVVFNIGIKSFGGSVVLGDLEAIELVLFCAS